MFHKMLKLLQIAAGLTIASWLGYATFRYVTHIEKPVITIAGIDNGESYQGTMQCSLTANSSYKISTVKLILDGKPFTPSINEKQLIPQKISSRKFAYPFGIDTLELTPGKHVIEAFVTDSSYQKNTNHFSWHFYADNVALKAAFLAPEYKVDQGKTAHLKINASKKLKRAEVAVFGKTYHFCAEVDSNLYECFIPISCEQKAGDTPLIAELEDAVGNKLKVHTVLSVIEFAFKKQKGFTVDNEKLDEEKEISLDAKILNDATEKWLTTSPQKKLWTGAFLLPMDVKRITTPHGEIRMTPVRGRYLHNGVDLVNAPRSVVWASQSGKIIIKERYTVSGNTVVIDHGLGVFTKYCHLDSFADIEVGDDVKKGNPIGRVGKTGYASGYHLHWELTVNNISVDPLEWTTSIF